MHFVVFITGASVLIVEIVATRILSPYYGNTIFTVSSVISVILSALSFGYYTGGRLADRHPSLRWFFAIILLSGLALILFHFIGAILLPIFSLTFTLSVGPLISSIFLFFLPAFLLGTLSPYAIKLQSVNYPKQGVGSVAGKIFFWSTLGSIIGSLLAGFALIPNFGINQIIIANGVVLFFLGLVSLLMLGLEKRHLFKIIFMFVLILVLALIIAFQENGNVVYSEDGVYEKITIYDSVNAGRPTRFFQQDFSSSGAMYLDSYDPTDHVYEYTKYYAIYKIFTPDIENALVIGGGAYTIPKALLKELPNAEVDVSEIEPSLFDLSKKYFRLSETPRLKTYVEDGRRLLRHTAKKYDLIFSDVYYSLSSVPPHFTTKEFFRIAKEKLSAGGVFIANLIGDLSRQQPSLIFSEIKTFQTIFPNSYFIAVDAADKIGLQNIIFVGYKSNKILDLSDPKITNDENQIIQLLENKTINLNRFEFSKSPILTDNFSPIEYLTAEVLRKSFNQHKIIDGREMLALIDQQLRYGPRFLSAPGHKKVQNFLIEEMKTLTQNTKIQSWQHKSPNGQKHQLKNIVGRLYPSNEKRIILATHYDSKKFADKDTKNQDQSVPGANDSASGIAVLLELARIINNSSKTPKVGVDVVFFDGEEGEENQDENYTNWKPLGSTYFAEHLNEIYGTTKPFMGIVLDMVCDKDLKILKEQFSVQNAPTQLEAFWDIAIKIDGNAFSNQIVPEIRDDHTPLNQAGIASFLLIDFEYPYFHTTNDTLDKCSAKSLETIANAVLNYVYALK